MIFILAAASVDSYSDRYAGRRPEPLPLAILVYKRTMVPVNGDRPQSVAPGANRFEPARAKANRLYERLHADILNGRLRPGEALSETRLAADHAISRTPVREVFQRLGKDGLIRVVPQVGTFVAPISLAAVGDSQFIREALECRAVRRAAERIAPGQLRDLRRQLGAQERRIAAGDQLGFFVLDERMHRAIAGIAGHPAVWELIASVKTQLDRVRYLSLEHADWLTMIFRQHEEIVARLEAHDPDGAEDAMQRHLRTAFAAIDRIAAQRPNFFETNAPLPVVREVA
jgi:DNA-binding GntR family transcriptional regulator